jgi:hypothetical protein
MQDILEVLKNDYEYYNGVGRNYLSNSDIGTLLSNPRDFGRKREDNGSFAEGRYFHQLLIEPDKAELINFVEVSTRNTKEYKAYLEANKLPYALLKKEKERVEELVGIMKANIQFYDAIYADGNEFEVPAVTDMFGMQWKGKADIVGKNFLIDLKTTGDIHKFKWSAKSYNYDSQAYIYQNLFGKPLVFFVIDKSTGQLGIFRPTENFIKGGEAKVIRAVEVYNKYFGDSPSDNIDNYCIEETLD